MEHNIDYVFIGAVVLGLLAVVTLLSVIIQRHDTKTHGRPE